MSLDVHRDYIASLYVEGYKSLFLVVALQLLGAGSTTLLSKAK